MSLSALPVWLIPVAMFSLLIIAMVVLEYFQYKKYSDPNMVRAVIIGTDRRERRHIVKYDNTKNMFTLGKHTYEVNSSARIETTVWHGLISISTFHYDEGNPSPRIFGLGGKNKPVLESPQVTTAIKNHVARDLIEAFNGELLDDMMRFLITLGAIGLSAVGLYFMLTNKMQSMATQIIVGLAGVTPTP